MTRPDHAHGRGRPSTTAVALLSDLAKVEFETMPFHPGYPPTKGRWSKRAVGGERWIRPTMVVEVSLTEWTPDGHIRHPTFRGVRRHKAATEVRREAPE